MGVNSVQYDTLPVAEVVAVERASWNMSRNLALLFMTAVLFSGGLYASQHYGGQQSGGLINFLPPAAKQETPSDFDFHHFDDSELHNSLSQGRPMDVPSYKAFNNSQGLPPPHRGNYSAFKAPHSARSNDNSQHPPVSTNDPQGDHPHPPPPKHGHHIDQVPPPKQSRHGKHPPPPKHGRQRDTAPSNDFNDPTPSRKNPLKGHTGKKSHKGKKSHHGKKSPKGKKSHKRK